MRGTHLLHWTQKRQFAVVYYVTHHAHQPQIIKVVKMLSRLKASFNSFATFADLHIRKLATFTDLHSYTHTYCSFVIAQ